VHIALCDDVTLLLTCIVFNRLYIFLAVCVLLCDVVCVNVFVSNIEDDLVWKSLSSFVAMVFI